ncbi:MAG: DUF1330 domain-containing protein [Sedimentisphaerales bacterium]|nr:DUF1330 domain-containing protein [Sedimentisphaerales bacterium]
MSVYFIVEIEKIIDLSAYSEYVNQVTSIIGKYGGKYLARGGRISSISGSWQPAKIVIIRFDGIEQLRNCFNSPEYHAIAPLREKSTKGKAIVVEGVG